MSINIQLEDGLKKISGQSMTKEKIISKLGYTPASVANVDELSVTISEHAKDTSKHFSGNYDDLTNKPEIEDDGSDDLIIADDDGNIIFKVDKDGTHTTDITLKGNSLTTKLDELDVSISEHANDESKHFSGDYEDLINAPDISTDSDDKLIVTDDNGNKILQVDEDGLETTKVKLLSGDLDTQLDEIKIALSTHTNDESKHFSGDYEDLTNKPEIDEDGSDKLFVTDEEGNIIFQVDEEGTHTTKLELNSGDLDTQLDEIRVAISENAYNIDDHTHDASDIVSGTLSSDRLPIIPIAKGGTNATTVEEARTNLDVYSKSEIDDLKKELSKEIVSESDEWVITDKDGNIIARVDENGLETTKVTATTFEGETKLSKDNSKTASSTLSHSGTFKAITDFSVDNHTITPTITEFTLPSDNDTHYESKNIVGGSDDAKNDTDSALINGNVYLNHIENNEVISSHKISGTGATTVTTDDSGNIEISSTDTTYSAAGNDLGLVQSGGDVTINNGIIIVNDDSHNHTMDNIDGLSDTLDEKTTMDSLTVQLGAGGTIGGYKTGDTISEGTSIKEILLKLLQKAIPATYTKPTLTIATVSGNSSAGSYEYGTTINAQVTATFTKNDAGSMTKISIKKDGTAILDGTTSPFTSESESIKLTNTVTYTASAEYGEGNIKNDNLGNSSPNGHITAGSIESSNSVVFTPYRQGYFYGVLATTSNEQPLDTDIIRKGTKKNGAYAAGNLPLIKASSVSNRKRIFVACPDTNTGVTKVIMPSAQNADCTSEFKKLSSNITVKGAENSEGIEYKVWVYEPASISDDQTFTVTLG